MKNCFTRIQANSTLLLWVIMLLSCGGLVAQTTNSQSAATQCYTGPTISVTNSQSTAIGGVNFTTGLGANQIPPGHRIVDVLVQVVWSKSDLNSCTPSTNNATELSHVGFRLRKAGSAAIYLATSAGTAAFPATGPTVASFSGSFPGNTTGILFDTITFRDGARSLLPAFTPNTASDTFRTNNDPLAVLNGLDPTTSGGLWQLEATDDAPGSGPALCIHSYCITVVTCDPGSIVASCQANPQVALDNNGVVNFNVAQLDNASDVSCFLQSTTFSPTTATCADVGTSIPVTMTFTDRLGNTASCVSNAAIVDTTVPVLTGCSPVRFDTIYLDNAGVAVFQSSQLNITDNCGNVIKEVRPFTNLTWGSQVTFNCVNGIQRIWGKGTDPSGNVDSCQFFITVLDTIAPTAICGRFTAYLGTNPNGAVSVTGINVDGGSFDACSAITQRGIGGISNPPANYTCADIGIDTVTLFVSDAAGNIATCDSAIITIVDTISPTAICQPYTVYLNATGNGTLVPANVDNNSTDICGIDSSSINGVQSISYTCADIGTANIRLHVLDPSGNIDSCTAIVTIADTLAPTAICRNRTIYINNAGTATIVADSLNNNSVDVCSGNNLTFEIAGNSTATFNCSNIGANTVQLTVLDGSGNAAFCNATVTVADTVPPTAICTTPTIYLNSLGSVTLNAAQLNNGSTDNCGIRNYYVNTVGVTSVNFNCSAINTPQNVTLIVEDSAGRTASCATTVTVLDTINPIALCNASYTATLDNSGNAIVEPADIDSLSSDNCSAGINLLINGAASQTYTCADVGTINAILTVTDSANNVASCSSTIIVRDNQPPIPACQTTTVFLSPSGIGTLSPSQVLNVGGTSDNCGTYTATFQGGASTVNYECDSIGSRSVRVIVTDNSGNSSFCTTTVIVRDTVDPTAICRATYTVQLDANGSGFIVPMNLNNGSNDICGIDTLLVNGVDTFFYNCTNSGNNTAAVLTVRDGEGNEDDCTTAIRINDPISPMAICKDTILYLDNTGVVTANPTHIDGGSTDNCNLSLTINGAPSVNYNCSNIGNNTAFLTATDQSGNTNVCPATITIADTIRPVANCTALGAVTLYVPAGQCFRSVPASRFNNGSTDNCSATLTYTVGGSPNVLLTTLGVTPITLTVRDGSGQSSTCTTNAILRDTIRPTMICKTDTVQLDNNGAGIVLTSDVNNGSTDNCGTPTYTINGQPSLAVNCTNLGLNTVTLQGSDASGNRDSCTAQVLVQDNIAPQARCFGNAILTLDASTGNGTLVATDIDNGSTDNCTIQSYTLSRTNFSCQDIGLNPHTITMVVTDQSGNVDSCTSQLTVRDTVAPNANCVATSTVYLVGTTVSITPASINNGSTDNCAIQSYTLNQSTFTCANIGNNTVTLTVTDSSGNPGTCTSVVNVLDTISPVPNCNNLTVQISAGGVVSVAAIDIAAGSFDNCTIDTFLVNGMDSVSYTCANIGNNVANIYIEDESGRSATCTAIITVEDNIAPVAACIATPLNLQLDANGIVTIVAADIDNGSTDNCGAITTFALSQDTFRCVDIASSPNTVTLTVTDNSGNTDDCTAQVVVNDTIRPNVICQPDTVYLNSGGTATIVAANFDAGSTDACGITSLTFRGANSPVTCADIGTHNITLIATDANGNTDSCTTTLTVLDSVAPTLTCINDTLALDAFGNLTVDNTTTSIYNVTDACGTPSLTFDGAASVNYTCADTGVNTIVIEATDAGGNIATCNAIVTIEDVTAPSINCANSIDRYLDVNGQLVVDPSWILANVIEACGIDTVFANPDTMNCANVSPTNNVVITVIDNSGNSSTCSANIPVLDTIPPTMVCRDTTVCLSGGFVNVTSTDIDGGTTDACGLSVVASINGSSNVVYTCADIGTQLAILEREDQSGNTGTCQARITVQDCTPPTAVCRNFTAVLGANGQVRVAALGDIDFGSNDDCSLDSTSFAINGRDTLVYSCASIGTTDTVLFTVADNGGNIDSCTAVITVVDQLAPIARCTPSTTAQLNASGVFVMQPNRLNLLSNPSSDNCSISGYLINGQPSYTFDCTHLGTNIAVLTVTDGSGNTDTCHTQVTIQDLTRPTVSCVFNTSLVLDSVGEFNLSATALVASSSDNCGIASVLANGLDTLKFTCDSIGSRRVTVTVQDSSGNNRTCSAIVSVSDTISPVAICPTTPVQTYLVGATNGATYIQAIQIDSASYDNCGIVSYLINGQDSALYTCNNVGVLTSATLTVSDINGTQATCTATIEVLDTINPTANCRDINVTLNAAGIAIVAAARIDSMSMDNCSGISLLINGQLRDTFNCSNVGAQNNALLTVTDAYGNQSFCTSTINVIDNTRPNIQCPGAAVNLYLNSSGLVIVDPRTLATASDTCSILFWFINSQQLDTFDCSHTGTPQLATIRVEDPSGNFRECNVVLNILDTIPPVASCQNAISIALDSTGVNTVTYSDINLFSTDNCGIVDTFINGQLDVTYTCDSVANSPLIATLTVTDASNNTSQCTTVVNLVDNISPIALCKDTVFVQLDNNSGLAIVQAISLDNGSTDACTPLSFLINNLPADTFRCQNANNANPSVLTVTDVNGNPSTCISQIQVVDVDPPTVICRNVNAYVNNNGQVTVTAAQVNNGSFDNCAIFTTRFSNGMNSVRYTCADTGQQTVTLIVSDLSGNVDSCTAIITVRDTLNPVAICQNASSLVVDLTNNGRRILTPADIGTGTDNCAVDSLWLSKDTITCTDIGRIPITLFVLDVNGNQSSCTDTITVTLDRPTIILPTQDTTLCEGADLPLRATIPPNGKSYRYQWIGPNGAVTFNPNTRDTTVFGVTGADAGDYIFRITPNSANGCPADDTISLNVNVVPAPILAANTTCAGDSAIFYLVNANNYTGTTFSYDWRFNGTTVVSNPNDDTLIIAPATIANNGNYTLRIEVDGCADSSAVPYNFSVIDLPSAPAPFTNLPCDGQPLTFFANPTDSTRLPYTYAWSSNTTPVFNSILPDPVRGNANQTFDGTYTVTITDSDGCASSGSVAVAIRPTPQQPNIFYTQPLCIGDLLELQDTTNYTVPPLVYYWSSPNGTLDTTTVGQLFLVDADFGDYMLTVTSGGCASIPDTQNVQYESVPVALDDNFTVKFRDSIINADIIINDVTNPIGYTTGLVGISANATVIFNNDGTINYSPNGGFFGEDTLLYSLCDAQCPNSCDTAKIIVNVTTDFECFIPNGFSPNGDGINDEIIVRCRHEYPNAELEIFSRWGTRVYIGAPSGWQGQFDGNDLPDGTYFYVLKLNDKTYVGNTKDKGQGRVGDQYTGFFILQR